MWKIHEVGLRLGDGPRLLRDFILKLVFFPAGVSGEGFHESIGMVNVRLGFEHVDASGDADFSFSFPENAKGELVPSDGAAEVNGELPKLEKIRVLDEIADFSSRGMVQDEAEGAVLRRVFCEEDYRFIEGSIAEGGRGEEELVVKFRRGRLRIHPRRMNGETRRVKTLIEGFVENERDYCQFVGAVFVLRLDQMARFREVPSS